MGQGALVTLQKLAVGLEGPGQVVRPALMALSQVGAVAVEGKARATRYGAVQGLAVRPTLADPRRREPTQFRHVPWRILRPTDVPVRILMRFSGNLSLGSAVMTPTK